MTLTLQPHPTRRAPAGPVFCVVMDGVGLGRGDETDAVALAHTPVMSWLDGHAGRVDLKAHGTAVGMPSDKDMGNSEVGHNVLGAGRVFDQGAKLVARAIADGSIFAGPVWRELVAHVRSTGGTLHFLGLLSDGNVHSHIDHLLAMLRQAASEGAGRLRVHALLDGRDVPARSALTYAERLEAVLAKLRAGGTDAQVASGGGRMVITMDRYEADWPMVERGWQVHVHGQGRPFPSLRDAIETLYAKSDTDDQYLEPFVIAGPDGAPVGPIRDGDAVVLFNFRGDRAMEISQAFEDDDFTHFDRAPRPDVRFAGMMLYDGDRHIPRRYLVAPPKIADTMGELLARAGKVQLACSETQKFGHVTYFWNGNRSEPFDPALEDYVEVPSDPPPPDRRPWMRAAEIVDAVEAACTRRHYDFVRINFANGDMVGHTGDLESTRLAVACVDLCVGRIRDLVDRLGGALVVTADHGNADHMFDRGADGSVQVRTSHSLNPVPLWIYDPRLGGPVPTAALAEPQLANVAGTCLELLGFAVPEGYAPSLLG